MNSKINYFLVDITFHFMKKNIAIKSFEIDGGFGVQ